MDLAQRVRDLEYAVNILLASHPRQKEIAKAWGLSFVGVVENGPVKETRPGDSSPRAGAVEKPQASAASDRPLVMNPLHAAPYKGDPEFRPNAWHKPSQDDVLDSLYTYYDDPSK